MKGRGENIQWEILFKKSINPCKAMWLESSSTSMEASWNF